MKSGIKATLLLLSMTTLASCGGGGGGDSVSSSGGDDGGTLVPYSTDYSDYKLTTRATNIVTETDTSSVSLGIFDDGFRSSHQELSNRETVMQNYDDVTLNDEFVAGVYGNDLGDSWSWTDHGTAAASVALGFYIGMAPEAQAVTSINRNILGAFDYDEYIDSFTTDIYGFLPEGLCVQLIEPMNYPWCVDFPSYHVQKMKELATYAMPVMNFSFTRPFGHYQMGVDLTFDQTRFDNGSLAADFNLAYIPDFYNLYAYDFNVAYDYLRDLLEDGELVIVNAAGNDAASITQDHVLDWQYLQANSANPLAQTILNSFFDPDVDANTNGTIEDSERGITGGLLFVGALDVLGELAWYSNYPGSSPEVQARFIVAPGNIRVAEASGGVGAYTQAQGTSFAAPVVSGAIALLKARHPAKTAREIVDAILETANTNLKGYSASTHGQGLLDVYAADLYLYSN